MSKTKTAPDRTDRIAKEQRAVLNRIISSPFFAPAQERVKLLTYLFEHKDVDVNEHQISEEVFGAKTAEDFFSSRARQHCKAVRDGLEEYAKANLYADEWRFWLPLANKNGDGYRLRVKNVPAPHEAAYRFWQAHVEPPRPIVIVCNEPHFYRDESADIVVRISHFDRAGDGSEERKASAAVKRLLSKKVGGKMQACHLYAFSGEIGARDRIADWFAESLGIKTESVISRNMKEISDIARYSPILLGNARTNKIIHEVVRSVYQFRGFAYHVDAEPLGTVEIRGFTPKEMEALAKFNPKRIGRKLLLCDNPQPDKVVFSVITRLPNPFDSKSKIEGAITIISGNYAKVLEEIASTLTDEERLGEWLDHPDWPRGRKMPRYFEALLSIRSGPSDTDAKPAKPRLRCLRYFDTR